MEAAKSMPFLHILLLGFSGAVIAVWFKHHFIMLPDNQLSIGLPFLIACAIAAPVLLFSFRHFRKNPSFSLPWRPVFILSIIFFFSFVIFNTQAFLRGLILADGPLIPLTAWASANLSFATKFGSVILLYFLLTIAFFSAGNFIFRKFFHFLTDDDDQLYGIALRIITGMFVWSTLLLVFGILGGLPTGAIWTVFVLLFVSERRGLTTLFRQTLSVTYHWQPNWKRATPYLLALGLFLIAFTLTQSLRPHPTGYDDMTYYMNRVHLISERAALVPGGNPYAFELIAASLSVASGDKTLFLPMSFGTYSLFLGALFLFGFGRALFSTHTGLFSTVILLSLPIGAALTIREVKPDTLLVAISVLVFWSLIRSITERKLSFWYIAIGLFSFAATIKLTALFLLAPIGITGIILLWLVFRKSVLNFRWQSVFITLGIGLLPLLPWIGYGATTHHITFQTTFFELISSSLSATDMQLRNELSLFSQTNKCDGTSYVEELSRFVPDRGPLERWLTLPWDITMNLHIRSFATEIGFFFLALLPFYFVLNRKNTTLPTVPWYERPTALLSLFALGYFTLWVGLGEGVVWYGYPGFILLTLLVAALSEEIQFSRILLTFFLVAVVLGLIGNTLVQMKLTAERAQILFSGGILPADQFLNQSIAGYGGVIEILNQDPESRVLLTSSQLWYGITDNDHRAIMDPYLDTFNCLHLERDDALTLSRLRDFNIRYVLYARTYNTELATGKRPTFNAKIEAFTDFIGHNLKVVWGSPYYTIFEVPPATLHLSR